MISQSGYKRNNSYLRASENSEVNGASATTKEVKIPIQKSPDKQKSNVKKKNSVVKETIGKDFFALRKNKGSKKMTPETKSLSDEESKVANFQRAGSKKGRSSIRHSFKKKLRKDKNTQEDKKKESNTKSPTGIVIFDPLGSNKE